MVRSSAAVRLIVTATALLAVSAETPASARAQAPTLRLTPVADGVYAALQPVERRFDDGNAAVVVMEDGVLVVDTHDSPVPAREVIAAIRQVTDKPVRWVVNTHWHGDHVQGNEAYRDAFPDAQFIAHEATARDIEARAGPALAEDRESVPGWIERAREALRTGTADGRTLTEEQIRTLRGQLERRERYWADIREVTDFVIPTRTFSDTLTLTNGRTVRLIHFGGHTEGDIALLLPAERVLITGDLLDDMPYTGHGSPRALIRTLHAFDTMDFETMIPGHGSVRHGKIHLHDVLALFESIVDQTERARAEGLDMDATVERVDLSAFRDRFVNDDASARYWPFFMAEAIRRAWDEMEPGDIE